MGDFSCGPPFLQQTPALTSGGPGEAGRDRRGEGALALRGAPRSRSNHRQRAVESRRLVDGEQNKIILLDLWIEFCDDIIGGILNLANLYSANKVGFSYNPHPI